MDQEARSFAEAVGRDIANVFSQVQKLGEWVGDIDRRTRRDTDGDMKLPPPQMLQGRANQAQEIAPVAPVLSSLQTLENDLGYLHEKLSHLESRLGFILPNMPATEGKSPASVPVCDTFPTPGDSTFSYRLAESVRSVRQAQSRVNVLLERLEI